MTRDFTVAVFVVSRGSILMHFHRKLSLWLPPGGHIEKDELPDEAALREVLEETGVAIRLVGSRALPVEYPLQLIQPQGIQLENISPGHQHIDLVYFGEPIIPLAPLLAKFVEQDRVGWYSAERLAGMKLTEEIRLWCKKALVTFS